MFKKRKNFYQQQLSITHPYFKQSNLNKVIENTKTILEGLLSRAPLGETTLNNKPSTLFNKPKTLNEWQTFHKTNEDGMKIAYSKPEGYHIDNNKLFIAGTRDLRDVYDWAKIPFGNFKDSKIYKNIEPIFKNNPEINYIVGHSAGGSAALELEKNYPDRKITTITYNSPIFERADPLSYFNENNKPMRFAVSGDPVSLLDMNARTTIKIPDITKLIQNPPDPLLGLHTMNKTYSNI